MPNAAVVWILSVSRQLLFTPHDVTRAKACECAPGEHHAMLPRRLRRGNIRPHL